MAEFRSLEGALERAAAEGRNVLPDATDEEARLIEAFASFLLTHLEYDLQAEADHNHEVAERRFMDEHDG